MPRPRLSEHMIPRLWIALHGGGPWRPSRPILLGLVLLVGISIPTDAHHGCGCTGTIRDRATDVERRDGDGRPLFWRSLQRLEHPSQVSGFPAQRCYERAIKNAANNDVTDVVWEVASLEKTLLSATREACDAVEVPGDVDLRTGPLRYNPSGTPAYDTHVYAPKVGFPWSSGGKRVSQKLSMDPAFIGQTHALTSTISYFTKAGDGTVTLRSSVEYANLELSKYGYSFENSGPIPVRVSWGFIWDGSTKIGYAAGTPPLVPGGGIIGGGGMPTLTGGEPVAVQPSQKLLFRFESTRGPGFGVGRVIVRDMQGTVLTRSIASSFGPAPGEISDPK